MGAGSWGKASVRGPRTSRPLLGLAESSYVIAVQLLYLVSSVMIHLLQEERAHTARQRTGTHSVHWRAHLALNSLVMRGSSNAVLAARTAGCGRLNTYNCCHKMEKKRKEKDSQEWLLSGWDTAGTPDALDFAGFPTLCPLGLPWARKQWCSPDSCI